MKIRNFSATLFSIILIIILNFQNKKVLAQTPSWVWAKGAGDIGRELAHDLTLDASGNVYITGGYSSPSLVLDTFGFINPSNPFFRDIFIAKYDAQGNVLWAKTEGGFNGDEAVGIALDSARNIFVTGDFDSPFIVFGNDTIFNVTSSFRDVFILKYDPAGNLLWERSAGSSDDDHAEDVSIDKSGNACITGTFEGTSITFGTTTFTNADGQDVFVAKYDANGNVLWAARSIGDGSDVSTGIATDANNSIYISGFFNSAVIDFGGTILTNSDTSGLTADGFLVKYDSLGSVIWAKSFGGINYEVCSNLHVDANAKIYLTGAFSSPSITIGGNTLIHSGSPGISNNMFTACMDSSGTALWSRSSTGDCNSNDINIDANGNAYVTGYFNSDTVSFGSVDLIKTGGNSNYDVFVVKYNSSGIEIWAVGVGDSASERSSAIGVDAESNCYITGWYSSSAVDFGANTIVNFGLDDLFLAKLDSAVITNLQEISSGEISIYPNPTSRFITVDTKKISGNIFITIIDLTGKIIFSHEYFENQKIQIDNNNVAGGIYFMNLKSDEYSLTKKFIVNR